MQAIFSTTTLHAVGRCRLAQCYPALTLLPAPSPSPTSPLLPQQLGHRRAAVTLRKLQGRVAIIVLRAGGGPCAEQRCNDGRVALLRCQVQRGLANIVARAGGGPCAEQRRHDGRVAPKRCLVQRGVATPILGICVSLIPQELRAHSLQALLGGQVQGRVLVLQMGKQ